MSILFRVAGAIEVASICLHALVPETHTFLPLGGNPITEVGLLFGPAFVIDECWEALGQLLRACAAVVARLRTGARMAPPVIRARKPCNRGEKADKQVSGGLDGVGTKED